MRSSVSTTTPTNNESTTSSLLHLSQQSQLPLSFQISLPSSSPNNMPMMNVLVEMCRNQEYWYSGIQGPVEIPPAQEIPLRTKEETSSGTVVAEINESSEKPLEPRLNYSNS